MAYKVSEKYNEVIYSGDAKHKLKLLFNGVEYETANVKTESVKIKDNILSNGEERFSLDNFVSKEAEITIHDIELSDIVGPVSISIGTLVDTEYEYVPIGIFNIQETPTTDNGKTTIKLRDNSVKFDYPYDASEIIEKNGGSVTMLALLQDICTKFSVELGTTDFANKDTTISVWDNTINARQYIMYIAEKAGCIAKIDRQGKLILADINKGEDITITSSSKSLQPQNNLARPLSQLKIQGKSEQSTRSGKNLLGLKNKLTTTSYGLTYSISDNEITINGTATASDRLVLDELIKPIIFDSSINYKISIVSSGSVSASNWNIQLRTDSANVVVHTYYELSLTSYNIQNISETVTHLGFYIASGTTFTNFKIKLQVEKGSTTTEYEQYGASPSPDYPSEIKSISGIENLFDKNNFKYINAYNNTTTNTLTKVDTAKMLYIPIKGGGTYTITKILSSRFVVCTTIEEPAIGVSTSNHIQNYNATKITVTTDDTANYLLVMYYITSDTLAEEEILDSIMIEEGSIAHPYVPCGRYLRIDNVGKNKYYDLSTISDSSLWNNYNRWVLTGENYNGMPIVKRTGTWNGLSVKDKVLKANTYYTLSCYARSSDGGDLRSYNSANGSPTYEYFGNLTTEFKRYAYTFLTNDEKDYKVRFENGISDTTLEICGLQLEENEESTEYEEYRNDVTYVNLAKENLFDKDNANVLDGYVINGKFTSTNSGTKVIYIPCESNTTYTASKISSARFIAGSFTDIPTHNAECTIQVYKTIETSLTITTGENDKYLAIFFYHPTYDTLTEQEILDTLKIYEGSSAKDYYDLCSIGDTKDEYEVISGKGTKRINEVVLNGSETWTRGGSTGSYYFYKARPSDSTPAKKVLSNHFVFAVNYTGNDNAVYIGNNNIIFSRVLVNGNYIETIDDFKTWLSNNPVTVQYELATPEEFEIESKQVKLYEDINDISLISDIETELEATYSGKKEHIQIPVNLLESYKVGDKLKISRVVYEDAIRKFEYGTENDETLYINSANPYITDSTEVQKIYEDIRGYELYSLSTGKIIGNPALDSDDIIEFTYNDETYYTLGQNELTYNGVLIQKFNTQIGTKEKTKENVTLNTEDSKYKRMFTRMDQAEGNIELNTSQITNVQSNLKDNYYTIEQANQLIQNAETGVTNTFSEAGGNNIFRNTGLWFKQSDSNNPYEFWQGLVSRVTEERASNSNALLLQSGSLIQEQTVPNGKYTISFKYKKVIELSNIKVKINDVTTELNGVEETEFIQNIEVNSNHINVEFISDTNNGCEIYDLMVNAGNVKLAYSQNQNETTTDTVNISKGITITSTDTDTTFKANADGIRTYDKNENRLTEFTDTGMITKKQIVEDEAEIVGVLIQRVGNQTWFTKI